MTREEVIENNKLIAEFMEFKTGMTWLEPGEYETPHAQQKWIETGISCGWEAVKEFTPEEMLFQSSWDWLMPVVEKIESLPLHDLVYNTSSSRYPRVYMYSDRCIIKDTGDFVNANVFNGGGRLMATYGAVIEFIKWYNQSVLL